MMGSLFFWMSNHSVVPIMMYHHVVDLDHHEANWVNPKNFEKQMKFLQDGQYHVITLNELVDAKLNDKKLSKKTVVITFDDGYLDNYEFAMPILKKYQFPATIFVPSEIIGDEGIVNVSQLKEMMANGFEVGSHGLTGEYLPGMTHEEIVNHIGNSKKKLEELLGVKIQYFAYPIGGFSDAIKEHVKTFGYKGACATNRGFDRQNNDVYELNRIRFSNADDTGLELWGKLSGFYNLFRKAKNPY